jgi:GNAT superfamily N-acetyltransferase
VHLAEWAVTLLAMKIIRVDPFDDEAFADWHAAMDAGARHGRTDPPIWRLPEMLIQFRDTAAERSEDYEAYAAVEDGTVVGTGSLELPLRDNKGRADIDVSVPPRHRRRGVGTAVFEALQERAAALGRRDLVAAVQQPIDAEEVPGVTFARRHGFTLRNVEIQRVLDLPAKAGLLEDLLAETAPAWTDYRIISWQDACPQQHAEQYAYLKSRLMTDAPTGDLRFEAPVWDVTRLRAEESIAARQGRTVLTAVAVATDGTLAGHTQIGIPAEDAGKSFQWDTLVLPEHRGHRLGLALKVTNLMNLTAGFPDRTSNTTWNAEQNTAMNAVNDRLGFRSVEKFMDWQRDPV